MTKDRANTKNIVKAVKNVISIFDATNRKHDNHRRIKFHVDALPQRLIMLVKAELVAQGAQVIDVEFRKANKSWPWKPNTLVVTAPLL